MPCATVTFCEFTGYTAMILDFGQQLSELKETV